MVEGCAGIKAAELIHPETAVQTPMITLSLNATPFGVGFDSCRRPNFTSPIAFRFILIYNNLSPRINLRMITMIAITNSM